MASNGLNYRPPESGTNPRLSLSGDSDDPQEQERAAYKCHDHGASSPSHTVMRIRTCGPSDRKAIHWTPRAQFCPERASRYLRPLGAHGWRWAGLGLRRRRFTTDGGDIGSIPSNGWSPGAWGPLSPRLSPSTQGTASAYDMSPSGRVEPFRPVAGRWRSGREPS